VHLLGVQAESGGIGFHDCDAGDQVLTSLALVLQLLREITNPILVEVLLDGRSSAPRILSLALLCRIDFPVQTVLVERSRADAKCRCDASHVERTFFRRVSFGDREMIVQPAFEFLANA
jgi:hypothetical protein